MRRDDKWLFQKLDEVWDEYFSDVPQDNDIQIVWGRKARQRLGSIKQGEKIPGKHPETIITINSLFKDTYIPEYIVIATIAHELAHYAHGFHSPIEQKYQKPHEGGIVHKELAVRGVDLLEKKQKKWLKENWRVYLDLHLPRKTPVRKKRKIIIKWI